MGKALTESYLVCRQVFLTLKAPNENCRGNFKFFSSPGQSPGRAMVLAPTSALVAASALAKCFFTLKFFI